MYDAPHQFEPLLPAGPRLEPLLAKAHDLSRLAAPLAGIRVPPEMRTLLRSMNSYYTNRIEGEHTRPSDIELALRQDFSSDTDLARRQRLAVAHIHTEERCEAALSQRLAADGDQAARWLYSTDALTWLHGELFQDLSPADLQLADGSALVPGQLRQRGVAVGRHEAPAWQALPAFMARWQTVYGSTRRG